MEKLKDRALFFDRFPDLQFLLTVMEFSPVRLEKMSGREIERELKRISLEKINTLYVYGLGEGEHYFLLKDWLSGAPERQLVFLEKELGVIEANCRSGRADEIFADAQVYLRFLLNPEEEEHFLDTCSQEFPFKHTEILFHSFYKNKNLSRCRALRLKLLRKTTVEAALFFEELNYPRLIPQVIENIKLWPGCFWATALKGRFKGVPAIVCGAGPSLEDSHDLLKNCQNSSLIIGGGSTVSALTKMGIEPHIAMAIDPNPQEYACLHPSTAFETPFCYGSRVLSRSFNLLNGPYGYLNTRTGGKVEQWLEKQCGIKERDIYEGSSEEALSVTTSCISFAAHLGCSPIIFAGIDLSFREKKQYAAKLGAPISIKEKLLDMDSGERILRRMDVKGNPVYTNVKWVMESSWISLFAQSQPQTTFIDARPGGLPLKGIQRASFEEIKTRFSFCPYDIQGLLHAEIQSSSLFERANGLEPALESLRKSIETSLEIAKQICAYLEEGKEEENPLVLLCKMDLSEELAYKLFISDVEHGWKGWVQKHCPKDSELIKAKKKWNVLKSSLENLKTYILK